MQEETGITMIQPPFEALLNVEQVAAALGFHPESVREMARQGQLPAVKVGKYWKFRITEIEAWIASSQNSRNKS